MIALKFLLGVLVDYLLLVPMFNWLKSYSPKCENSALHALTLPLHLRVQS